MKLHLRNLAVKVGAPPELIPKVGEEIEKEPKVTYDKVVEIVKKLKADAS